MNHEREMMPMWSINHCRIRNGALLPENMWRMGYYSCGVDSVIDLFDYAICGNISERDIENKSELLQLMYKCHQMRENERRIFIEHRAHLTKRTAAERIVQHRLKISMQNNTVWDWLCTYDRENWCKPVKGTIDAELYGIPIHLVKTEFDKQLFGLRLLWKCQNEHCRFEMNEHLFPVSLGNCDSIKNGIEQNIRSNCPCGSDWSFIIKYIGDYVLFDLTIAGENASIFNLEETLTITGIDRMELIGAIKHTGNHYQTIAKIEEKWYVLNDMRDEAIVGESMESCLNLLDQGQNGKMSGVCWLVYRKIADREVNIGDESDDMDTEQHEHFPSSSLSSAIATSPKQSASQRAKERKRRRDGEYRTTQKRIIIEELTFNGNDSVAIDDCENQNETKRMRNKRYYAQRKSRLTAENTEREKEKKRECMKLLRQKKKLQGSSDMTDAVDCDQQIERRRVRNERYYAQRKSHLTAQNVDREKQKQRDRMKSLRERAISDSPDCSENFEPLQFCKSCMTILFGAGVKKLSNRNEMSITLNIEEKDSLCTSCKKSIESNKLPKLCNQNNLCLGIIPACLKNLNFLERRFICRIQTYMTLLVLPGGQKSQKGMAVYFESEPEELIKILPQIIDNVRVICVSGNYEGYIRPDMIKEALKWLKDNNKLYRDIQIDMTNLTDSPAATNEANIAHELNDFTQSGVTDIDHNLPRTTIRDIISNNHEKINFPLSNGPPIMFSGTRNAEALAFPWLFPDGMDSYDDDTERTVRITLLDYLKSRFLNKDNRFRCDIPYLMAGVNRYETERLKALCSVYMRIQKTTSNNTENDTISPMTVADLRTIMDNSNNGTSADDNWLMFMRSVRGTASYWKDQLWDLLAKMKVLGPPDIFLTLSVADMHWKEVELLLKEDLRDDYKNISDAVQKDPVIVVLYADKKFREMLKWIKDSKVLGKVTDHHCRAEFQNRGTVHYHVFLWISECPGLHKNSSHNCIKNYIDSIISTELPSNDDLEFQQLVEERQTHHHTKTCQKPNGKCRFNFPRKACKETRILYDFQTRATTTKGNFYETKRSADNLNLNAYNPAILKSWKANMDIQMVHGERGLAYYICKYVLKAEPEQFRVALRELTNQMSTMERLSKRARMMKLGMLMLKMRQMSAQEAAYRITGLKMVHSSRTVQTIGTLPPNKRMRRVLSEDQIAGQPDNSTELFYDGPIEVYRKRPMTVDFEKLSLFEFTSWYEKEYNNNNWNRCVPLIDKSAYLKKRRKFQIVRSSYVSMASDEYYYSLLLLHLPHRTENDLSEGYDSFKEAFLAKEKQLSTLNLPNEKFVNELLEATRRLRIANEIEQQLTVINSDSEDNEDDEQSHVIEVDVIEDRLDPMMIRDVSSHEHRPDMTEYDNSDRTATHSLLTTDWSQEQLLETIAKLTKTQLQTLTYIQQCLSKKQQILLFIMGNAGTGKSFLMTVIIEWLRATQATIVGEDPVIVGAPTGLAAKQINGRTLHSLFHLPVQAGKATTSQNLNDKSMRKFLFEMKGKRFFICDEISMVGEKTFRMIHERLDQVGCLNSNGKNRQPFGGFHLILGGDFYQLAPIRDKFAFECVELFDLFEIVWLTQNMRQQKDKKWCNLLDRLRLSTLNIEDTKLLAKRSFPKEKCDRQEVEMCLYPTTEMVTNHNNSRQSALSESRIFESTDIYSTLDTYGPGCAVMNDDLPRRTRDAGGLLEKLELSIGTRVMLTRNLLPTLCNGDQGYVTAFETNRQNITTGILIKFDDKNAGDELKDPQFNNNVKIERIDCEFMYKTRNIVRTQFPLMPSWAVTIHKAQGMSLGSAVVNVSNKIFEPGQTYVALSRIREITGVFIEDQIDLTKIKTSKRVLAETEKWLKKWKTLRKKFNNMKKN